MAVITIAREYGSVPSPGQEGAVRLILQAAPAAEEPPARGPGGGVVDSARVGGG